mmetsp:Transcript_25112/g.51954  ORF Transcript_25112/g.51954 Transcript_25112/m.51954 type:complete len:287 (-) Transcript_25112:688-1548(-)
MPFGPRVSRQPQAKTDDCADGYPRLQDQTHYAGHRRRSQRRGHDPGGADWRGDPRQGGAPGREQLRLRHRPVPLPQAADGCARPVELSAHLGHSGLLVLQEHRAHNHPFLLSVHVLFQRRRTVRGVGLHRLQRHPFLGTAILGDVRPRPFGRSSNEIFEGLFVGAAKEGPECQRHGVELHPSVFGRDSHLLFLSHCRQRPGLDRHDRMGLQWRHGRHARVRHHCLHRHDRRYADEDGHSSPYMEQVHHQWDGHHRRGLSPLSRGLPDLGGQHFTWWEISECNEPND